MKNRVIFVSVMLLLLLPVVYGDYVVANTNNWKNIYSAGIFATLSGDQFTFLVSQRHSELLIEQIEPENKMIVIETTQIPFIKNYADRLKKAGFTVTELKYADEDFNLALAKDLQTRKFILVDPTYGYDAISVAPLATASGMYVLFADKENIDAIAAFFNVRAPEQLIVYGDVDQEVKDKVAVFKPQVINKGNRFKNNLVVADQVKTLFGSQQVVLTNGEFLENDIFTAGTNQQPIIFIGKTNPPVEVLNYLKTSRFKTSVLLGNDLLTSAQKIKDTTGTPLFIKFGKGVTGDGGFKEVQGLEIFKVPIIDLLITVKATAYNTLNKQVELVLGNEKQARTYLKPAITILADGEPVQTLGEGTLEQIEDGETRGFVYQTDLMQYVGKNLTAQLFIPYGSAEDLLEYAIIETVPLEIISEDDKCNVAIDSVTYNKQTQRFEVEISSEDSCYAQVTIRNVLVNDEQVSPQSDVVAVNGKAKVTVKQAMSAVDIADNEQVTVQARYGKRAEILTKFTEKTLPLQLAKTIPILLIVIVILALIIVVLLWRRKKR